MRTVEEKGAELEDMAKEKLIMTIISGILFLDPFIGAAVGGLGRAGVAIARTLSAAEAGTAAGLTVYEIIENPQNLRLMPSWAC